MERRLIHAGIKDRGAFEKLRELGVEKELSSQGEIIWKYVSDYYGRDESARSTDISILQEELGRAYPNHVEVFRQFLTHLDESSPNNIVHNALELRVHRIREALSAALVAGNEEDIHKYMEELKTSQNGSQKLTNDIEIISDISTEDLVKRNTGENRIKLWPPTLTEHLGGGALRGHHLVLFACTDIGKTLFALNLAYGFVRQGLRCLYIGNEDPGVDLLLRFRVRTSGMTMDTILESYQDVDSGLKRKGADNFTLAELVPGTISEIRSLIKKYKPDCLIVDQVKNLNTYTDREVDRLERAATGVRNLCKEFNLVGVSIAQAADSANGKCVLDRGDVYGSNVGIPGTADLMIGIGATHAEEASGYRTLSFPKNKVNGNKKPLRIKMNYNQMSIE